jgi:hypothetical protein
VKQVLSICVALLSLAPMAARAEDDPLVALIKSTEPLLLSHRFDALEAMADGFRRTDARFPGGHSRLYHFYRDLGSFAGGGCDCSDDGTAVSFARKQEAIDAWLADRPQSLTAQIVNAQLLINYAWVARTRSYGSTITDAQWALYRARLREAGAWLYKLNPKDDPNIYSEQMLIAQAEPDARPRLDALYMEAVRTFPRFFHYYADRADRLQWKWYGRPGELAALTRSLAVVPGGDDGEIAYAFVAGRLAGQNLYASRTVYRDAGLTWAGIQQAYAVRERRYGLNSADWNTLLFFAWLSNDPRKGAEFVKHIGNNWIRAYWWSERGYAATVKWTHSADKAPKTITR